MIKFDSIGKIQSQIIRSALIENKRTIALFILSTVIMSILTIESPVLFSYGVKNLDAINQNKSKLIAIFIAFSLMMAGIRLFAEIRLVLMRTIDQNIRLIADKVSFKYLIQAPNSLFIENNSSRLIGLINGLHQSNTVYTQSLLMVVLAGSLDLALSFAVVGVAVNWLVALFVVVYGLASVFLNLKSAIRMQPIQKMPEWD
ncbi:6TM ABC transporter family protein [Burkholderia cepacia]|uniref:hypothetical protein n=1 Tax=Burkholderia cepacia TaxID=292 RepID=UPI00298F7905|nr:hypothetical protein [Burkholderia cepacia]